jgi:hypothetical protein
MPGHAAATLPTDPRFPSGRYEVFDGSGAQQPRRPPGPACRPPFRAVRVCAVKTPRSTIEEDRIATVDWPIEVDERVWIPCS